MPKSFSSVALVIITFRVEPSPGKRSSLATTLYLATLKQSCSWMQESLTLHTFFWYYSSKLLDVPCGHALHGRQCGRSVWLLPLFFCEFFYLQPAAVWLLYLIYFFISFCWTCTRFLQTWVWLAMFRIRSTVDKPDFTLAFSHAPQDVARVVADPRGYLLPPTICKNPNGSFRTAKLSIE